MVKFNSAYSGPISCSLEFTEPSLTKQSFKEECDINNILKRANRMLGQHFLDSYSGYVSARFEDVSGLVDLHTAHAQLDEAIGVFGAMPATLRERFANDPMNMIEFLSNPNNKDEARKLGMLKPEVNIPDAPAG